MIIKDIAMYCVNGFKTTLLKAGRVNIDDIGKQEILKNGLYHITKDEKTAQKILESQYLRPATGLDKNINSYGTACVNFFNGTPSIENYMKNLCNGQARNPYIHPTIVSNTIKVLPKEKEKLTNYRVRAFADDVIVYEGYCILDRDEAQMVYLVPDLVRDKETGKPIINQKTGRYDIAFREAQNHELEADRKSYKAQEDYLQFIEQERERLGYLKGHNIITNAINSVLTQLHMGKIEGDMSNEKLKINVPQIVKRKIQQIMTPRLEMGTDEKIQSTINEFNLKKKNPYRDKKFGEVVALFQEKGLSQLELKEELKNFTTSDIGKFFRQKFKQINKVPIIKNGIHGISHNNRVAILSMMIAQKEGILENDFDNKIKDILISAAYYHDIGRKKGIIIDNTGKHSKNSARKIGKMDLTKLDGRLYSPKDKKILQAVIEAHEGKDKDMVKVCKKYKIEESDIPYTIQLMTILKDADALDRVRLDSNSPMRMKTNLNPKYLRTNTSKQLLNASYQLETLSKKVSFDRIIAYKTDEQKEGGIKESRREKFIDGLRQGIIEMPQTMQNLRTSLRLKKEKNPSRLTGINIKEKITKLMSKVVQRDDGQERD